jgi:adenylate cyclase
VTVAFTAALEMQRIIAAQHADVPLERRMLFRIGVHLDDVIIDGDDIFGEGVNVAARLQTLAEPGGICVPQTVYGPIKNKVVSGARSGALRAGRLSPSTAPTRA